MDYNSQTNDSGNSDTDVELLRPASPTETEIEKHKVILNLQQRLLRLKKRNQQLKNEVKDLAKRIVWATDEFGFGAKAALEYIKANPDYGIEL